MRNLAVQLDELGVIDIGTKTRPPDTPVSIARHLYPVGQTVREIAYKLDCRRAAAVADPPGWNQLRIGIERYPRPEIARAFRGILGEADVALLGVAERPNLIELDALARVLFTLSVKGSLTGRRPWLYRKHPWT
jgi:hypothetical protein